MLKIYIYKNKICYTIKNNYLNENGAVNIKNIKNAFIRYKRRKAADSRALQAAEA